MRSFVQEQKQKVVYSRRPAKEVCYTDVNVEGRTEIPSGELKDTTIQVQYVEENCIKVANNVQQVVGFKKIIDEGKLVERLENECKVSFKFDKQAN